MKQRDLIKKLEAGGFVFDHHGSNHDTGEVKMNLKQLKDIRKYQKD